MLQINEIMSQKHYLNLDPRLNLISFIFFMLLTNENIILCLKL